MSHGSSTIKAMESIYQDVFSHKHIRALAIGGLKRNYNAYFGEDDTTVSVYSSRPDHYSLTTKVNLDKKRDWVKKDAFTKTELIPFVPVQATHFKFDVPGVASLPSDCLTKNKCDHPSIGYILQHLAGERVNAPKDEYAFKKYRVNIYIDHWISVELTKPDGEKEIIDFKFRPGSELSSSFSGIVDNSKESLIALQLFINKKLVKIVKTPIQGGFSTFLRFELEKETSVQ